MIDIFDVLTALGILVLGVAAFMAWGPVAALAYAGTVLIVVGLVGAMARGKDDR